MSESNDTDLTPGPRHLTRRRALVGLGASAVTVGLAACAPGTGGGDTTTKTSDSSTPGSESSSAPDSSSESQSSSESSSSPATTEPAVEELSGTVAFWTINLKAGFEDYFNGMIKAFEDAHPGVVIDWTDVPGDQIDAKFLTAIASSDVPDAVNMWNDSISGVANKLTDLSTVLSGEQLADYQPGLLNPFKIDDRQVAIPWYHGGVPVMIYRKSLMAKVDGFNADLPAQTYGDLLNLAQNVYDSTKVYGTALIPRDDIMIYNGVKMLNDERTEAAFATPEGAAVFERFRTAYDGKGLAPGSVSNEGVPPEYIDNGKVAFIINGPAWAANVKTNAPELYDDIDLAPAPTTADGKYLLTEIQTLVVPSESKNPKAGAEFIKFITDAENQLAFCKLVPIFPSSIGAGEDPFFSEETDDSLDTKGKLMIGAALPKLEYVQFGTTHDSELGKVFRQGARDYLTGSASAADALDGIADQWNTILAG